MQLPPRPAGSTRRARRFRAAIQSRSARGGSPGIVWHGAGRPRCIGGRPRSRRRRRTTCSVRSPTGCTCGTPGHQSRGRRKARSLRKYWSVGCTMCNGDRGRRRWGPHAAGSWWATAARGTGCTFRRWLCTAALLVAWLQRGGRAGANWVGSVAALRSKAGSLAGSWPCLARLCCLMPPRGG